jgi:hypothetical protein
MVRRQVRSRHVRDNERVGQSDRKNERQVAMKLRRMLALSRSAVK